MCFTRNLFLPIIKTKKLIPFGLSKVDTLINQQNDKLFKIIFVYDYRVKKFVFLIILKMYQFNYILFIFLFTYI